MQFIKTHMISLICGVLGLVFIGGALLGMMQDGVKQEMESRARIGGEIGSLKSSAKNQAVIDAEKVRGAAFEKEFKEALKVAEEINLRKPLIDGVFPSTKSRTAWTEFKAAYINAVTRDLAKTMQAGDVPNEQEIADEAATVAQLLQQKAEEESEGGRAAPSISVQQAPVAPTGVMAPGGGSRSGRGGMGAAPMAAAAGAEPLYNPVYRAQVNKARNIRVYAGPLSFHHSPIISAASEISAEEMWYAQVGLWVQQDVAKAIAVVNEAARQQGAEGGEISVENAPVKRLEKVLVQGYQTSAGPLSFAVADPAAVSGASTPGGGFTQSNTEAMRRSFLGTTCNEEFDVVRYTLTVIMDQRDILALIDALTKQNLCKCIYLTFAPAPAQEGYLYGAEPVVRVTMDFEAYFMRAFYAQWMPNDVKTKLGAAPQ